MRLDTNQHVFLALLKAGLWEQEVRLSKWGDTDYESVFRLAQEQSVTGLLAAGLENLSDVRVPQSLTLQIVGETLQLEKKNRAMNNFVCSLFEKLEAAGVGALLVKGQGIAQCYERPLWRACGDVDLLLEEVNYQKAKSTLEPFAESEEPEVLYKLHKAYCIKGREVELHGNMRGRFLKRVDHVLDKIQKEMFERREFRTWKCGENEVPLPSIDNDVVFVFTHILQHFFVEGIGLRQICDWCRLLWTYREEINVPLLEKRLKKMGMLTEWMTFGSVVVDYLGMPPGAMPLYSDSNKWKKKAHRVIAFVLETGNFGHNRDRSYYNKYPFLVYKTISITRHTWDGLRYSRIFPLDAIKIWIEMIGTGFHVAVKGL